MQVEEWVERAGGFARTRQLLAAGATERMLTSAVRTGRLRRARNGWYSTREADDPEFRAARVGGMLAGLSALRILGVWEWQADRVLRVVVRHGDSRLRSSTGRRRPRDRFDRRVRVSWDAELPRRGPDATTLEPLLDALVRVVREEPDDVAALALDWACCEGRIDRVAVEWVLKRCGRAGRRVARLMDARSQSLLESVTRIRLLRRGHRVRSQAPLSGGGDIDLLIDDCVALECDGRRFHEGRFVRDREKDLLILTEGMTPVRVGADHIRDGWPLVLTALDAALARHRAARTSAAEHSAERSAGNSGRAARFSRRRLQDRAGADPPPEFPTARGTGGQRAGDGSGYACGRAPAGSARRE
ncbi:type IV toxin-antitoxin system AbiEi family antitoxin domain-containing protein [Schumannella soli]|uniref:Type IV toxin-antitoxin system AbiEi family antitoxin domain-containing protein n=1 Tax=Schumannella soli TaxID=2590779 RepID=A0A506XTG0_9MICO|nr:type IV toxin-antitoxin system AbiEi family antitoxin domain-containing protein [Schumannella soli]TPW76104.1 type IV toxin-antitoxin system AbiEi family antitoxin domain-containing protein [Schumannella soli]